MPVLTHPCSVAFSSTKGCARETSKTGENGQNACVQEGTLALDSTVGSRVWSQIHSLSELLTTRLKVGIVRKDGSWVAIDCVTSRSYSHEGDGSVYSQAYARSARIVERKRVSSSAAARDRGCWKGTAESGWACVWMRPRGIPRQGGKVVALGCVGLLTEKHCSPRNLRPHMEWKIIYQSKSRSGACSQQKCMSS